MTMTYTTLRIYAWWMLFSGVLVHGGLTTVQPEDVEKTETTAPAMRLGIETHKVLEPDKSGTRVGTPSDEDPDARSAYINNQFVDDGVADMDEGGVQSQPLHEILQKQMEHVLSVTAPNVPHYALVSAANDPGHQHELENENMQRPPKTPTFSSKYEAELEDYSELDSDTNSEENGSANSYAQLSNATPQTVSAPTTRRKQTTHAANIKTTRRPSRYPTAHMNSTSTRVTPTTPTQPVQKRKNHYNTSRPQFATKNNDTHHTIFRTISTGSQYVNSPMGDLIIKFSVAYAKPTEKPANVNEALRALSNNLLKQFNGRPRQQNNFRNSYPHQIN